MDAVRGDKYWRCQQSTYRTFPILAHRFLFVCLITVLLISSAERTSKTLTEDLPFNQGKNPNEKGWSWPDFAWIALWSASQNDSSQECGMHGLVSPGRTFAWPNSQTCGAPPAVWLLKNEADSDSHRTISGLPEAHQKLFAFDRGLTGSRKGSREQWEQPGRSVGVWCRSHSEHLPRGFAAQWMIASSCTGVWTLCDQRVEGISQGHPVQSPALISQKSDQRV